MTIPTDLEISGGVAGLPVKGHDRRFGASEMARLLSDAGLETVEVEHVGRWVIGSGEKAAG